MDEIEELVRLPPKARPMNDYAHYYAISQTGEITAVFQIPETYELRPGEGSEDLGGKALPCPEMAPPWQIGPGERRWFDDACDLPGMSDGGCRQITVVFDIVNSAVRSAKCDGPY